MYKPEKHNRRSIRLNNYDYSNAGAYFVTICTRERYLYFDEYSELQRIVCDEWKTISKQFPHCETDAFVVMPNHVHGVVFIHDNPNRQSRKTVGATLAVARREDEDGIIRATARIAPTLGQIIGAFKSRCSVRWIHYIRDHSLNAVGKIWQRSYYEHVIRNENDLERIRCYIENNPLNWHNDRENKNSANFGVEADSYYGYGQPE